MSNYHLLDQPLVLQNAFYPRNERSACPDFAADHQIYVNEDTHVSCRIFIANPKSPSILFFHGNGEVAGDYNDVAPYFFRLCGVNFIVAEFRGYGLSNGSPTFAGLIADAHPIFRGVAKEISKRGCREDIWVMGRSMGSVPALELAANHPQGIQGLIIESGFPCASRLVRRLKLPLPEADLRLVEDECIQKLRRITVPALIIHGERDSLVNPEEAYTINRELGSVEKRLIIIPHADHNSVMAEDIDGYFQAIKDFITCSH